MATYNPPQPFWKRFTAGVLDTYFAYISMGNLIARLVGPQSSAGGAVGTVDSWITAKASGPGFALEGWPAGLLFVLLIAYFVVLGRTGGTLFQRLFRFKRA